MFSEAIKYLVACAKRGEDVELAWFENVYGLADAPPGLPSNLDWCVYRLQEEANRFVIVFKLDPQLFSQPQSRGRFWFLTMSRQALMGCSEAEVRTKCIEVMQQLIASSSGLRVSLDECLLSEADQTVVEFET